MTETSDIASLAGNVVEFAAKRKAIQETIAQTPEDVRKLCESLLVTLESFQEGMENIIAALVQHEARIVRLEQRMGNGKRTPAVLNMNGQRIR